MSQPGKLIQVLYDPQSGQIFLPSVKKGTKKALDQQAEPKRRVKYADREEIAEEAPVQPKKPSPWSTHCKKWCKANGCTYAVALSNPDCRADYYREQSEKHAKESKQAPKAGSKGSQKVVQKTASKPRVRVHEPESEYSESESSYTESEDEQDRR